MAIGGVVAEDKFGGGESEIRRREDRDGDEDGESGGEAAWPIHWPRRRSDRRLRRSRCESSQRLENRVSQWVVCLLVLLVAVKLLCSQILQYSLSCILDFSLVLSVEYYFYVS